MSHSKSVYVLTKGHLTRFQNTGIANCAKCLKNFSVHDIIATSTSKHYCYNCAVQINLVTGKLKRDLHNDEFISQVNDNIESIGKNLKIDNDAVDMAKLLICAAIENANYVSKNSMGVACAAISVSCKIKKQIIQHNSLPVSKKTLQKNTNLLQKSLISADVSTLSKMIHEGTH